MSEPTTVLGKALPRIEGARKVTGAALYAADHRPEGYAFAYGVTSSIASGEVISIDVTEAKASPGVLTVLHVGDPPGFFRCPSDVSVGERRPPLEDRRIYYGGQLVAVVVAETFAQARWAAGGINIEYRGDVAFTDLDAGIEAHGLEEKDSAGRGNANQAFAQAEVKLDATYRTPVEVHNAMELHGTVAWWENGQLVVETATQAVVGEREALAHTFGIPLDAVTVRSAYIGGGFGSKLFLWPHTILAAEAARRLERPVKISLTRQQQFTTAGHRPFTRQRLRIGATRDGRLTALLHEAVSHTSMVRDYVESCTDQSRSIYQCPNVSTIQHNVRLHTGSPTPMRGPGETPGMWALESALDELAVRLGIDPLELRLRNLPDHDPDTRCPWSAHTHGECLRLAARRFGWERRTEAVGSMRDGDEILGWGIASASWPAMRDEATVRVDLRADGTVRVACATQDIGTGTYTVFGQVVSEITGLPFARIEVALGDTRLPSGPTSGGSMATATVVPAIAEATRDAIESLLRIAVQDGAPFAGTEPDDLRFHEGHVGDGAGREVPFAEVLAAGNLSQVAGECHAAPGDEEDAFSFRSFGAHCVEVRWDPLIARLRVSRVASVIDTGRIINHHTASNQVYGAIVMGIGMALLEESVYERRTGRVVTDNIADYLMPVNADVPEMDLLLLDRPDPHIGEYGARGIGEIGLTGVAPAIAAAVYHATGKRFRELPITIARLLADEEGE